MKVLITSGGTKIAIDRVRHIGNMSSGTFATKIATEFLHWGHPVTFIRAKDSKSPFRRTIDLSAGFSQQLLMEWVDNMKISLSQYKEWEYKGFQEYAKVLETAVKTSHPDVIMLAAAVSDYGVKNYVHGKIRSANSMNIELEPLPKIISQVKVWAPKSKLVGFKLLVDSTHEELVEAARKSIEVNGCDMVVANDLVDIKNSDHRVTLVFPSGDVKLFRTMNGDPNYLARKVAEHTLCL